MKKKVKKMLPLAARKQHYDLPLQRGSGGKLVVLIVGVMTYLTVLALIVSFGLGAVGHYWRSGLTGRMTIEVPYNKATPVESVTINRLVTALDELPGITAKAMTQDDVTTLVGPWLGQGEALENLPLPQLIDVTRANGENTAAISTMKETIRQIIPSAALDTHEEWLADLLRLAQAVNMILLILALILAITAAVTVAATAKTRLALHREEVDLLHLIGATDTYIASQFERQAFRLATEGAAAGLGLALCTFAAIALIKNNVGSDLLPGISLTPAQWVCLVLTPVLAGLIAMIASRFTVLRALRELP